MTGHTFLILDDNAGDRRILEHVLLQAFPGSEIVETDSADEARDMCLAFVVDCLLVDYYMPQIDGVTFAEQIRVNYPFLPIVLVTGAGDEMLVGHAMRCGLSDYLPKSRISPESVQRAIQRAIDSCALLRVVAEQRAELENFAYALAHDFKQPIRQLRTFSQLIAGQVADGDSEDLQQNLSFLNQAADRLGNLVDVMAQYTLLNETPEMTCIEVSDVVGAVSAALRLDVKECGAELTFEGDGAVLGNATLLGQALQNLIVNGLKYNTNAAPRVDVRADVHGQHCLIAVSDNGIGIERQYLTDIFRPLKRLHTAAKYAGTGLGLTLARKAVVTQGGEIWCESEVGVGSTFFVRIPVAQRSQRNHRHESHA